MKRVALVWLSALLLAGSVLGGEDQRPTLRLDDGGRWVLSALPGILDDEDVRRHLESGLTTSFVFRVRPAGVRGDGGARIDMRYELWDEVYLVTVLDGTGRVEQLRHDSPKALAAWWSELEIALTGSASLATVDAASTGAGGGSQIRVSLAVVPFSQAELVDTKRWLTESIGQAQGQTGAGREGGASRAVGALIATSMQRRAIRSMTWNLRPQGGVEP